jgi:sugar lactone lactonase YvrE
MDTTQVENQFRVSTKMPHVWPESIDMDRFGNIYFTDAAEGTLYRIRRNKDNSLAQQEEALLKDFKRASGLSIDPKGQVLYMGVTIRFQGKTQYKIVGIPLLFFSICQDFPYRFSSLKECAELNNIKLLETAIPNVPNGVIFNSKQQSTYYTYIRLGILAYFFKFEGHIGKTTVKTDVKVKIIHKTRSPNGIDLDRTDPGTILVVAITLDNAVKRIRVSEDKAEEMLTIMLQKSGDKSARHLPDGLICLENGDVLVAAFGSGQILYLAKDGDQYRGPFKLAEGLGHPTDLVLGLSSQNRTRSLFVTTKETWFFPFKSFAKGKVVEVPYIDTLIKEKKSQIGIIENF